MREVQWACGEVVWRRADRFHLTCVVAFWSGVASSDYGAVHAVCSDCSVGLKPANSVFAVASLIGVTFDGASDNCPW
jgi:hypothetical protein